MKKKRLIDLFIRFIAFKLIKLFDLSLKGTISLGEKGKVVDILFHVLMFEFQLLNSQLIILIIYLIGHFNDLTYHKRKNNHGTSRYTIFILATFSYIHKENMRIHDMIVYLRIKHILLNAVL